ncbi:MAG: YlxR family protein [Bacilli bacterium]
MKQKKIPLRLCVITRERLPKKELIRIVKNKENKIAIDPTGKLNGKGAYLKKDIEVIKEAKKSKKLDNVLDTNIPDEIYDKLIKII